MASFIGHLLLIILVKSALSQTIDCGSLAVKPCPEWQQDCYKGPCYQTAPFYVDPNRLPYNLGASGVIITQRKPVTPSPFQPEPPQTPGTPITDDTDTTTTTTTSESPQGKTCPMPGDICSDDITRDERCCNGEEGGSARCKYMGYDGHGNRIGKCCIRNEKFGCTQDSDCCVSSRVCSNGQCLRKTEISPNGESMFNNIMSVDNQYHLEKDELKQITTSEYFELSAIILAFICNLCVIWCCYKRHLIKNEMISINDNVHGKVLNINIDKKHDESCFTVSGDDGMDDIIDSEREITSSSSSSDNDIA